MNTNGTTAKRIELQVKDFGCVSCGETSADALCPGCCDDLREHYYDSMDGKGTVEGADKFVRKHCTDADAYVDKIGCADCGSLIAADAIESLPDGEPQEDWSCSACHHYNEVKR